MTWTPIGIHLRAAAAPWLTLLDMWDQVRAGLLALVGGATGEGQLGACAMCHDPPEEPVVSACGHPFCKQCISHQVGPQCPSAVALHPDKLVQLTC